MAASACGAGDTPGSGGPSSAGTAASAGGTTAGGGSLNAGNGGKVNVGGSGQSGELGVAGANSNSGSGGVASSGMAGVSSGGRSSSGGTGASGGANASGGTSGSGGTSASGGTASTGADQCKPIGWATRSGRSGGAFSVTGGGNAPPNVVTTFADLAKYAADSQPRVIHIDGTLGSGWSGTSGDRLEIKSNKTIIGLRAGTQLKAVIHINDASNVILRNVVIRGPGSNQAQAWDNINIEGSSQNIWVDHSEFWDGQDGNADVVKGPDNVTFTWCIFGYTTNGGHNLSNLIASSDSEPVSEGKLDITFMFNWWKAAAERKPRCRYGEIHVVNNLFTADTAVGPSNLGVTNGFSCNILTENNHFIKESEPIDLGKETGAGSVQQAVGNLFENTTGNQKGSGTAFTPPYEYKSFMLPASQVKALVQKNAGATLTSPTACPSP